MVQAERVEKFPLDDITIDERLQVRASVNRGMIEQYCDNAIDGTWPFPPVVLMLVEGRYLLIDGRHRIETARKLRHTCIPALVSQGTWQDAIRAVCSSNSLHGLQRTNADKRLSIELALREFPDLSNREVAKLCKVSHTSVNSVRAQADANDSSFGEFIDAVGKYDPRQWTPEIGNACYAIEHEDGSTRLMFVFQAKDVSRDVGGKWMRLYDVSENSGYYSVAEITPDELGILKPAYAESVPVIIKRFFSSCESPPHSPVKSVMFINDQSYVKTSLAIFSLRGKTDREIELLLQSEKSQEESIA